MTVKKRKEIKHKNKNQPIIPSKTSYFQSNGDKGFVSTTTDRRIKTLKDLIEACEIDTETWEIERWVQGKSEGYRKDRKVTWKVLDQKVIVGDVEDKGTLLIKPLYSVKAWLKRKTQEIRERGAIETLIKDARKAAPRWKPVRYKKQKSGMLVEIDIPDIHFGKLAWAEESGEDYDIKIAYKAVMSVLNDLLGRLGGYSVSRILLPLGNDYFNVNNSTNETAHGTIQQEDTRWQKTFTAGRRLAVEMINQCAMIAPVDVMIIPGNHDEERVFYLGEALSCMYYNSKHVSVDNRAAKRKYYPFGANLIGLTHGYHERKDALSMLMPNEVPKLWAKSRFREWHLGDKHHLAVKEENGITIRILRAISATDTWHFDKGYIGALRGACEFVWHPENGLVSIYNAYYLGEDK